MLASSLISCGSDATDTTVTNAPETTAETAVETEALDALELRMLEDDGLGEVDFGGKEFRIAASEEYDFHREFFVEEQNGDQCDNG